MNLNCCCRINIQEHTSSQAHTREESNNDRVEAIQWLRWGICLWAFYSLNYSTRNSQHTISWVYITSSNIIAVSFIHSSLFWKWYDRSKKRVRACTRKFSRVTKYHHQAQTHVDVSVIYRKLSIKASIYLYIEDVLESVLIVSMNETPD